MSEKTERTCRDCIHLAVCHMWFSSEHYDETIDDFIDRDFANQNYDEEHPKGIACKYYCRVTIG